MKLLPESLKKQIPALNSTENLPLGERIAVAKFFSPIGAGTWYVIEGEEQDGDFIFFGLVDLQEQEFGYFSLSELESVTLPFGLKIERDIQFTQEKISEILEGA
jgi:hypothetical protein